jgi:phosphate starvation-inducible protein PhoH
LAGRGRGAKAQKRMQNYYPSEENTIHFNPAFKKRQRSVELIPKSRGQEKLIVSLLDDDTDIVVATGPAGTGKTYLAMQAAISSLKNQSCDRIVMTRPAVGVDDEQHGFLPGSLLQKMEPWTRPLFDVLNEYFHAREITQMIEEQVIEISPLAYMRGRTFKNSWIIADEMQNATPGQMKMLLTRIGQGSKIIVTGDVEQTDRTSNDNGLIDLCHRLSQKDIKGLAICKLGSCDIQRHPIIDGVLEIYR